MMQLFPTAVPRKAPSAADRPANTSRTAADPVDRQAFRTALSAASEGTNGNGRPERPAARAHAARPTDDAARSEQPADAEADAPAEVARSSELLAMLLPLLASVPTTPAMPTTPDDEAAAEAGATMGASLLANGPTPASSTPGSPLSTTMTGPVATQTDPALTGGTPGAGGMPLPAGLTPVTTLDPIAEATLATIQKLLGQDAQATTATASTPGATSAAGAAASATATSWAELAADFGARIVATNGPTARVTGPAASPTGQPALAEELPSPTIGSTAQAAGAGASAGLHLPGQAVAAPGAPAQGTAASLGEALDAGPMADAETGAGQGATEAATDRQPFSIGVAPSRMVSEAPAAGPVQASAATPVVSQIADGALLAARNIGQSVEMILQPEGLGTVSLRVTVERAGLGVHIAVDNPQTRELVQASWPQLQQTLDQRGLSVQSMLLDLSQGRSGDAAFSQFQQFNDQQFTGQRPGEQRPGGGQTSDRHAGAGGSVADEGASTPSASARGASRVDYRI